MEEKYKNRISWERECEMFTPLYPSDTGLPVTIYLDDGYAAPSEGHPVVLFVQNSYKENDYTFRHLICMTADNKTENVFGTKLRITYEDYVEVRLWVMKYKKLIRQLSYREIDVFGFMRIYNEKKNAITESVVPIFEMATIDSTFTGLEYNIWIDNGHTWKESGHAPRIKVQTTVRSKKTTSWNPFILSTMSFLKNKDSEKYSAKTIKEITMFVKANYDFIMDITTNLEKSYKVDEITKGLLTLDQIKNNLTSETRNNKVRKLAYMTSIGQNNEYTIVYDSASKKYSLVSSYTDENVLNDQWFDTILPVVKTVNNVKTVDVWSEDGIFPVEIKD